MKHETKYLMDLVARPSAVLVRGEGSHVWDSEGRKYLDFVQGWAVNTLGHCPPVVVRALAEQSTALISSSPAYFNAPSLALCERLVTASGLSKAFLCSTGAEANEGVIKLARKWGRVHRSGAYEIITTVGGFHGRTLATMAATGKPGWDAMFPPNLPGFVKVPFGDAGAIRAAIGPNTAAILVEPIQGEAGVIVPKEGYLRELRAIADEAGILLAFDEVQTGMGRTGKLFCHEYEGVRPDILSLGKGIGAGVPLAALLASERADVFARGEQGGTYAGNPLMAAVGVAVFDAVTAPGFLPRVLEMGEYLRAQLASLDAKVRVVEVRGKGLLVAARLETPCAEAVRDRCFELGLLVNAPRPDTLRFVPALDVSREDTNQM